MEVDYLELCDNPRNLGMPQLAKMVEYLDERVKDLEKDLFASEFRCKLAYGRIDCIECELATLKQPMKEIVIWKNVAAELPDHEMTVLVTLLGDGDPVGLAYYSEDGWIDCGTGGLIAGGVRHWAELPEGAK